MRMIKGALFATAVAAFASMSAPVFADSYIDPFTMHNRAPGESAGRTGVPISPCKREKGNTCPSRYFPRSHRSRLSWSSPGSGRREGDKSGYRGHPDWRCAAGGPAIADDCRCHIARIAGFHFQSQAARADTPPAPLNSPGPTVVAWSSGTKVQ